MREGLATDMKVTSGASGKMSQLQRYYWKRRDKTSTYRVITAESEAETVGLVQVERVFVEHTNVHLPFLEIFRRDETDPWRKGLLDLKFALGIARN